MARSGFTRWHAYTDGSWTPLTFTKVSLFATTNPGSHAGAAIVFFPMVADGAEVGCQDVYMMEVLAGTFASKFTSITTEIWTDCMAMLKAAAESWKTTTRYADHALRFETIRQAKPNLKWTGSHPENHKDKTIAE